MSKEKWRQQHSCFNEEINFVLFSSNSSAMLRACMDWLLNNTFQCGLSKFKMNLIRE